MQLHMGGSTDTEGLDTESTTRDQEQREKVEVQNKDSNQQLLSHGQTHWIKFILVHMITWKINTLAQ